MLINLGLPSKTIENSFNVLNRQIWTNQKESCKNTARGEDSDNSCSLCGATENTQHLMFECPEYSEIMWDSLSDALNSVSENERPIQVHMFNVMYNTEIKNLPEKMEKQVSFLLQEGKRNIVNKRYARCQNQNLNNIIITKQRAYAHWIIICKKIISLRFYQGKDKTIVQKIMEYFEQQI